MKLQMFACMWCAALACGGVSVHAMEALASVPQQDETVSKFISGSIIDKKTGETLIGVSVAVFQQGSLSGGTTTNLDGQFNLSRPTGDFELRLSLLGYKTLTIPASKCKPGMKIEMEEDTKELGEVVVNGFFAKDKQSFTGAVKQISGIEIKQVSGTNLISAIAALTPGMELVQNTAAGSNPNHVPELIIRGMSSFSNEGQAVNQPTIILDGTEISLQELYDLDMNEVESINVLKDAAATALYGSKAANGVIVITRKPIKESTLRVAYNFTGNVQFPVLGDYNVLNAAANCS